MSESRRNGVLQHPLSEQRANEVYLRIDGTNKMLADLNMGTKGLVWDYGTLDISLRVVGAVLYVMNAVGGAFKDIKINSALLGNFLEFLNNKGIKTQSGIPGAKVLFQAYDDIIPGYVTCAELKADGGFLSDEELAILRAGDVEHRLNSLGTILIDRTTATKYRLYVDNGVLSIEAV